MDVKRRMCTNVSKSCCREASVRYYTHAFTATSLQAPLLKCLISMFYHSPFMTCQSTHFTLWWAICYISIIGHPYMCCFFTLCLPDTSIQFPCQQFLWDYSGALVWKLRKCVITERVGGERSSVRGGMPKGRNKWVAEVYIKRSSESRLTQTHSHTLVSEFEITQSRRGTIQSSLIKQNPLGLLKFLQIISNFCFFPRRFCISCTKPRRSDLLFFD